MDLKSVITTVPLLRKAWRVLPGPLRIPLLVGGAAVWLYRRSKDEEPSEA